MEKGKHSINTEAMIVTFGHVTKTSDGEITLTTSLDFSNVKMERLLKRAADAELIAWRAKSGIKEMTTAEAEAKFQNATIDCAAIVERVKHVETEEEKKFKSLLKNAKAQGVDIAKLEAMLQTLKDEAAAQDAMETGEESN